MRLSASTQWQVKLAKKTLGPPSPPIDGRNPAPISRRMGYFFSPFLAGRLPMVQHFSLSKKIFELGQ